MTTAAASGRPVIRADHVLLGYPRRVIARDLSFVISPQEILGIVGPNGCGKTTLLRTILGLLRPLGGRIGRDPELVISYVPQRDRLDTMLPITALEVVVMGRAARAGAFRRSGESDRAAARTALGRVGVESLGPELFRTLSGGQQQRVLIARALAAEPNVLVLDEPTAGMDIGSEAAVLAFLRELNHSAGTTIIVVTHVLSIVLNFATSIMLMAGGQVLHGAVDEVLQENRLEALYRVPVHLDRLHGQRMLVVGHSGASHA